MQAAASLRREPHPSRPKTCTISASSETTSAAMRSRRALASSWSRAWGDPEGRSFASARNQSASCEAKVSARRERRRSPGLGGDAEHASPPTSLDAAASARKVASTSARIVARDPESAVSGKALQPAFPRSMMNFVTDDSPADSTTRSPNVQQRLFKRPRGRRKTHPRARAVVGPARRPFANAAPRESNAPPPTFRRPDQTFATVVVILNDVRDRCRPSPPSSGRRAGR